MDGKGSAGTNIDRKGFLKRLVASLIGATALLNLKDAKAAAGDFLRLGHTNNDAGSHTTGINSTTRHTATLTVTNTSPIGPVAALGAYNYGASGPAVIALSNRGTGVETSGNPWGVHASAGQPSAIGVFGEIIAHAGGARGVYGLYNYSSGRGIGVMAETKSRDSGSIGVYGIHSATSGEGYGVYGKTSSPSGYALKAEGRSVFAGAVLPWSDNAYDCGSSTKRWRAVYARNGTIQTSHSRFKENIEPVSDIDCLSAIPEPIYFNWKNCDDRRRYLGFIGDHLPEIAKDDDGGVYTSSLIAILCGAVRQLKEAVNQLREENGELRRRIESRID